MRLFWKIFGGYVLLATVILGIGAWAFGRRAEGQAREGIHRELRSTCRILARLVADHLAHDLDAPALQAALYDPTAEEQVRLTVIAADGTVLADSLHRPTTMENHADRPEIRRAFAVGLGTAQRFSATSGYDTVYRARCIGPEDEPVVVRTALPTRVLAGRRDEMRLTAFTTVLVAILPALLLGLAIARGITGPLRRISRAARALARGERIEALPDHPRDEVGDLARAFNEMSRELDQRLATIAADRNTLRSMFSAMVEGVLAIDARERVVHCNNSAQRMLGLPTEPAGSIWQACPIPALAQVLSSALLRRTGITRELTIAGNSGEVHCIVQADVLRDHTGQTAGAVAVLHDITRLKQLEDLRRDFVADISHELKTPLTGLLGLLHTVRDDQAMPLDRRDDFLRRAIAQGELLNALTMDLLQLSRLEADEALHDFRSCRLAGICRAVADAHRERCRTKDIALRVELPEDEVELRGDAESLRQAIDNLLTNAVDYTPAGGRIDLRLSRDEATVTVAVSDTGPGIPHDCHERIFQRFFRLDKARSRELGGTGLGLAIVKHVARRHGGTAAVESDGAHGSTFRLRLPLELPDPDGATAPGDGDS